MIEGRKQPLDTAQVEPHVEPHEIQEEIQEIEEVEEAPFLHVPRTHTLPSGPGLS
jgi:hypothetical protein